MIGQNHLKHDVNHLKDSFPRFSIIAGPTGSGKKTLTQYIANQLGAQLVLCEISVAAVRDIIKTAYKQKEPMLYVLPDTDKMSAAAKNALLKVTEEPPRQAYFIMTVESTTNTLNTLVSRGTVFNVDNYTPDELTEYIETTHNTIPKEQIDDILEVCTVPGEIDILVRTVGVESLAEFFDYVYLVVDKIGTAAGSNAFKIGVKISFKESDDLWDLKLFLRAVRATCVIKLKETQNTVYAGYVRATSIALQELTIKGIHKQSSFDVWILNMRKVWRENCASTRT